MHIATPTAGSYSLDGKTAENLDFAERSRIRLTVVLVVVTVPLAGIPACSCSPRHTSRPNDRFEELSER
jgi:hypothetical protein